MYRGKERGTLPLFEELFPFGGRLDENNRWFVRLQKVGHINVF